MLPLAPLLGPVGRRAVHQRLEARTLRGPLVLRVVPGHLGIVLPEEVGRELIVEGQDIYKLLVAVTVTSPSCPSSWSGQTRSAQKRTQHCSP